MNTFMKRVNTLPVRKEMRRAMTFLSLGTCLGFIFGLVRAISVVFSHRYMGQKMYRLILSHFASSLNRGILVGFLLALLFFLFLRALALVFRKIVSPFFEFQVIQKRKPAPLIKNLLLGILSGYWLFHFLRSALISFQEIRPMFYQTLIVLIFFLLVLLLEKIHFVQKAQKIIHICHSLKSARIAAVVLSLIALLNLSVVAQKILRSSPRPNVLLIVADALRADHLGCYEYQRPTSPAIDEFAKGSLLFERAFSNSPWTKPSMGSIFTSLHPHEHDAFHWLDSLDDSWLTLPEVFRNEGYKTFSIQTNGIITKEHNFDQGFERYEEMIAEKGENVTVRFAAWLEKNKEKSFFAYLHYMDTHLPYQTQEKFLSIFEPKGINSIVSGKTLAYELRTLDEMGLSSEDKQHLVNLYDAEIRYFDGCFKTIIEEVKKRGLLEKTIIILTSDHGEEFWDHQGVEHGHTLYNELMHTPLIIKYSSHLPNKHLNLYVQLFDLFPTLLSLCRIKNDFIFRGKDLVPIMLNDHPLDREIFFEATAYGAEKKAIIKNGWKLIETTANIHRDFVPPLDDPSDYYYLEYEPLYELFNVHKDFSENFNHINDCPALVKDLKERLFHFELDYSKFTSPQGRYQKKKFKDMKSLGYIK